LTKNNKYDIIKKERIGVGLILISRKDFVMNRATYNALYKDGHNKMQFGAMTHLERRQQRQSELIIGLEKLRQRFADLHTSRRKVA
jgi:hypothetical protein